MDKITLLMTCIFNSEFTFIEKEQCLLKQRVKISAGEKRHISEKENNFKEKFPLPDDMEWDEYSNPILMHQPADKNI